MQSKSVSDGQQNKNENLHVFVTRNTHSVRIDCITIKKLAEECQVWATKNGFTLNPDKKIVEGVLKGLLLNEEKFGEKYCPCRNVTGDEEKDKKIICPCVYHKKEIEEQGHCHCLLFIR